MDKTSFHILYHLVYPFNLFESPLREEVIVDQRTEKQRNPESENNNEREKRRKKP